MKHRSKNKLGRSDSPGSKGSRSVGSEKLTNLAPLGGNIAFPVSLSLFFRRPISEACVVILSSD